MKLAPPHDRTHRHSERVHAWLYLLVAGSGAAVLSIAVWSLAWLLMRKS